MGIVVKKFGGSSVANKSCLENVARIICEEKENGVVVVVSAQKGVTDSLINKYIEIDSNANKREIDMLVSCGEQMTIALLSMMLQKMGKKSYRILVGNYL